MKGIVPYKVLKLEHNEGRTLLDADQIVTAVTTLTNSPFTVAS